MKLPIKFRGRTPLGETLYGDYMSPNIRKKRSGEVEESKYARIRVGKEWRLVTDNSVKQLCGYDADGNEVYEDDIVFIDKDGYYREYVAHLKGYATNPKDGCYITLDGRFDARLKEESA